MMDLSYDTTRDRSDQYQHHACSQKYHVDHELDQKYKVPAPGAKLYENGRLEIAGWYDRDPEARRAVKHHLGIYIEQVREVTGVTYTTPEGREVTKATLLDRGIGPFIYDYNHHMMVFPRHGHPVRYYGKHSLPMGGLPFTVHVVREEDTRRYLQLAAHELTKLAKTVYALSSGDKAVTRVTLEATLAPMLATGVVDCKALSEAELWTIGSMVTHGQWREFVRSWLCTDTIEVPFLYFKGAD
jgi:hypothetical protein